MVGAAAPGRLRVSDPDDVERAATALADGRFVAHPFANIYALTTRPDAATVGRANLVKGRPRTQVGSATTAPSRLSRLFDLDRLADGLRAQDVLGLVDELLCLGPFGFRGPAAGHLPDHLTVPGADGRWVQVIVPGYRCPSNAFLTQCLRLCGTDHLHITSANRSRHATAAADEPAHYRAAPLRADFGGTPELLVLEHANEEGALRAYPRHSPTSTTILGFRSAVPGRPGGSVVLERHGSLAIDDVAEVVARHGLRLAVGAGAQQRLQPRRY